MESMTDQALSAILTSDEVAILLRVHVKLVRELALSRQIPCQRVGRSYRFSRRAIVGWLEQREAARSGIRGGGA